MAISAWFSQLPCLGGVVNRESIPQPASRFLAEPFHHRLAAMRVQIVQHQVNGVSFGIADGKVQQVVGNRGEERSRVTLGK
jgi:hypothetical protein